MVLAVSENELEAILWLNIHRARNLVDRYPDDPLGLGKGLNFYTGAPESPDDLKKPGTVALRGEKLQREAFFMPSNIAAMSLRRPCEACDACKLGEHSRCEDGPRLKYVERSDWSAQDAENFSDLESRIQNVFLRWEALHYVERRAPVSFTGTPEGDARWTARPGQDTWAAFVTPLGIQKAREFCEAPDAPSWVRDALSDNRRSGLWAMTPKQRANAPQWQQKEFLDEGGRVDTSLVVNRDEQEIATKCRACDRWHTPKDGCVGRLPPAPQGSALRRFLDRLRGKKGRGR